MWINFRAGVAKGVGVTVGMTFILGILVGILTMLVDLPLIGDYFTDAKQYVTEYAENTNYKDDFALMNEQLQQINENLENETTTQPSPVD